MPWMMGNKQIKEDLKKKSFKEPEKYYPTKALSELGYRLNHCKSCKRIFYSIEKSDLCGDPVCSGGFRFIGNTPAKNKLDYIEAWKTFAAILRKRGYTEIPRYPVVARWREDEYWVGASIYDFQPYVVSGEVEPPANPLVVPQFCMRFNDVDNIGITGAHYSCFIMQGQHAFVPTKDYNKDQYLKDLHEWFVKGIGVPKEELFIQPDSWAGGGNAGVSLEFFSRGLEIANQVYMQWEATPTGLKDLSIKVLDMGQGQERVAWFSQGASTSYETTFPAVCKKLYAAAGIKADKELMKRFLPYASYLNIDEVENIDKAWKSVANKVGIGSAELKKQILPLAALYSVGEHARALLVALSDGALPSNVGGGYNLRIILRRALSFIDQYRWKLDLKDICDWHAAYLKPLFPELSESLEEVHKILDVEREKYNATKEKSRQIVERLLKEEITEQKLLQLYDSQGISPELIREEAAKLDKKVSVPENFYSMVSELHEKKEQVHATAREEKLDLKDVPATEALYFDDYLKTSNEGKVLKIIGNNVVLDKTVAYPTSGGQVHDVGMINGQLLVAVFKQGNVIVHALKDKPSFKVGDKAKVEVDKERRKQLAQHHTATHIISAAARKVLGNHVNQAGAKKTVEKAHLDITHYENVSDEELKKIEEEANKIVKKKIPVNKFFLPRNEAEKRYGVRIYQGGAVPGKKLRIVEIEGTDVECCGGTHLNNTSEAGEIKILKSSKIQDGIVRLTFTAGKALQKEQKASSGILEEAARLLDVKPDEVPARANELFEKWKKARKAAKKGDRMDANELKLTVKERWEGDPLAKTAEVLSTQPEHIINTLKRFLNELDGFKKKS